MVTCVSTKEGRKGERERELEVGLEGEKERGGERKKRALPLQPLFWLASGARSPRSTCDGSAAAKSSAARSDVRKKARSGSVTCARKATSRCVAMLSVSVSATRRHPPAEDMERGSGPGV